MGKRQKITEYLMFVFSAALLMLLLSAAVSFAEDEPVLSDLPATDVPVIYVTVDNSDGNPDIDAMNGSEDHSVTCKGTVRIELGANVPAGFPASDPGIVCSALEETPMEIKGRGNSTWQSEKKPYKLKLAKGYKKALLGEDAGASRHWVLIANYYDRTLLKDRFSARLGTEINMPFTPRGVPVELMMKNATDSEYEYYGSYYLSEQVRVEESRVDIKELKADDTGKRKITGGYIVQNGSQTDTESPNFFTTESGEVWANHTPDFDPSDDGYKNDIQKDYIRGRMQAIEDALYAADYTSSGDSNYRNLMDLESAAKYWLVMQASMNSDAYSTGSTYLYKDRDPESGRSKMFWGPLWDFDYAWHYGQEYQGFPVNHKWVRAMLHDTGEGGFVEEVKRQWPDVRDALLAIAAEGGTIDQYYEETKNSQANDLVRYPDETPPIGGTPFVPETAKEDLKAWIINRVDWMEDNLDELDNRVHLVIAMDGDTEIKREFIEDGWGVLTMFTPPEKEGYLFLGWTDQDGSKVDKNTLCERDMVITANYVAEKDATKATDILIRDTERYLIYRRDSSLVLLPYTIVPEDAQDKAHEWISSDEDIANIYYDRSESKYFAFIKKPGDVVLTAVLKSGFSRSMTLHIVEYPLDAPDSVSTEKAVYEMKTGDYEQIHTLLNPVRSHFNEIEYYSSDESVVTVNKNGAMRAMGPGRATVTVRVKEWTAGESDAVRETTCEVVVSDKKDDDGGSGGRNDQLTPADDSNGSGSGGRGGRGAGTGDDSGLPFWIALMLASAAGLGTAAVHKGRIMKRRFRS